MRLADGSGWTRSDSAAEVFVAVRAAVSPFARGPVVALARVGQFLPADVVDLLRPDPLSLGLLFHAHGQCLLMLSGIGAALPDLASAVKNLELATEAVGPAEVVVDEMEGGLERGEGKMAVLDLQLSGVRDRWAG